MITTAPANDGTDCVAAHDVERQRYLEFVWALQELMIDLKTPVDIYFVMTEEIPKLEQNGLLEVTTPQPTAEQKMSLNRFIVFPIINSLCKLWELCNAYGKEINCLPEDVAKALKDINRSTELRKVYTFRSTYTAHILRMEKGARKRPLTLQESLDALERVTEIDRKGEVFSRDSFRTYLKWIYSRGEPCVVNTVYDVIVAIDKKIGGIPARTLGE